MHGDVHMAVTWEMVLSDHSHGFGKPSALNMWAGDMEVEKEMNVCGQTFHEVT